MNGIELRKERDRQGKVNEKTESEPEMIITCHNIPSFQVDLLLLLLPLILSIL